MQRPRGSGSECRVQLEKRKDRTPAARLTMFGSLRQRTRRSWFTGTERSPGGQIPADRARRAQTASPETGSESRITGSCDAECDAGRTAAGGARFDGNSNALDGNEVHAGSLRLGEPSQRSSNTARRVKTPADGESVRPFARGGSTSNQWRPREAARRGTLAWALREVHTAAWQPAHCSWTLNGVLRGVVLHATR
jgi:hypothetical protein